MAYKRKRSTVARPRKARRTMRKPKTALKKMLSQNICSFKRRVRLNDWNIPGAGTWSQSQYYFRLSMLSGYTEITALFEQYRINAVKLTFQPAYVGGNDVNAALGAGGNYMETPRVYALIDRDGSPQFSTETLALENSAAYQIRRPNTTFSVYCSKPCVQIDGAVPKAGQWVDCDNANYDHWGIALGGVTGASVANWTYRVVATFYMQAKGVK